MSKAFFEVFPKLKVETDLRDLFTETEIERLACDSTHSRFKVVLDSGHLIHKNQIYRMQEELERQVFGPAEKKAGHDRVEVYIREQYQLSRQYTPKQLMKEYYDSLCCEFSHDSHIAGHYFREAEVSCPDDGEIVVRLEDCCFTRKMGPDMEDALERVFRDRCGVPARFRLLYEKRKHEHRVEKQEWQPILSDSRESMSGGGSGAGPAVTEAAAQQGADFAGDTAPWMTAEGEHGSSAREGVPASGGREAGSSQQAQSGQRGTGAAGVGSRGAQTAGNRPEGRGSYTGETRNGRGKGTSGGQTRGRDRGYARGYRRSDNPDCLYGREIDESSANIPLRDIVGEIGQVTVHGQVISVDRRDIRNNKTIVKFTLTDFTDSIYCKIFIGTEDADEFLQHLTPETFVRLTGMTQMDTFDHEIVIGAITGIMKIPDFTEKRRDHSERKRVELHCHTKMSDMDGVSECKDIVRQAYEWGMPAIAITDHGNVQAFPDANHLREDLLSAENKRRKAAGEPPVDEQKFFKVIYGVECYLVDDLKPVAEYGTAESPDTRIDGRDYVVFDLETTGFSPERDRIIEIGAYKVRFVNQPDPDSEEPGSLIRRACITEEFTRLVNPRIPIPYRITQLTHITDEMVQDEASIEETLPAFLSFCQGCVLVGHNVAFDIGFIRAKAREQGLPCDFSTIDTLGIARAELPGHGNYRLDTVAKLLSVELDSHHRGSDDAKCTADIFLKFLPMLEKDHVETYRDLNRLTESNPEVIRHLNPLYHCILLARNNTGRLNLYTMISASHLTYFQRKPRIPKSLLARHREGILVGSACVAGELYQAILENRSEEAITGIAQFYDYLEIQPTGNNKFLIEASGRDGEKRYPDIRTTEDIEAINRRIVDLGEKLGKPVCATCDVHFLNPEDEIYRTILQDGIGMTDEEPAPLYLRTTDEMLAEFAYLGQKKCEEVVVDNPRRIADMIEAIRPVRPDKCPPVIPNSDGMLTEICYRKAHEMYGDPLPEVVEARLKKELGSIIKNGYSVMYIIAQKLVWKSNEDGYLVGSRGSVGSSFVATMAGITEVNPLQPHYLCPNPECKYSDWDSDVVRANALNTGIDLPEKMCPKCGTKMMGLGFGIPFETFLGFKGDKEPDIDLNFSGEYQAKAHAYTKVIFGHEQTFKAGTIATVADKTAYGYIKGYYERRGEAKRGCEIERMVPHLVGVRRSTGQHPGGIAVLPVGEDINTFTPVQHPANDMTTDIVTTHFDYHSIDHNLLKLDILGHDDPTMIRFLQDITGVDPMTIPLNDPEVMSIFQSPAALGVTPEEIGGVTTGTLGIPEFGTKFVIGMLEKTKPTTMTELVKISGLSHGTDVYLGNAETHIENGDCTLLTCIGCRDDIMSYLISKGLDPSLSFTIMERVRKGKVAGGKVKEWPEWKEEMTKHGVPDWYIDSCEKIKYMFPKGHAAAYVMMALRIAWFKVHQPLAYYCAYFSIRATDFDYEVMAQGETKLKGWVEETGRKEKLTPKEEAMMDDAKLVLEFYARGFHFTPIDLAKVKSRHFQILDGTLMPSLVSINGMGEKAADAVVEAVKDGPFTSKNDFRSRTKVSQTNIDLMDRLGILGSLPETDQISLFDLFGSGLGGEDA